MLSSSSSFNCKLGFLTPAYNFLSPIYSKKKTVHIYTPSTIHCLVGESLMLKSLQPYILFFFLSSFFFFLFVVDFVIHWNETAMGLHVFPIPIPPPTSLSTPSLWVFPVHQVWALVSCIQPGLVICFTLDKYMFWCCSLETSHPLLLPESKRLFYKSVSFFFFSVLHIGLSLTSF